MTRQQIEGLETAWEEFAQLVDGLKNLAWIHPHKVVPYSEAEMVTAMQRPVPPGYIVEPAAGFVSRDGDGALRTPLRVVRWADGPQTLDVPDGIGRPSVDPTSDEVATWIRFDLVTEWHSRTDRELPAPAFSATSWLRENADPEPEKPPAPKRGVQLTPGVWSGALAHSPRLTAPPEPNFDVRHEAALAFEDVLGRSGLQGLIASWDATLGAPGSLQRQRGVLALSMSETGENPRTAVREISILELNSTRVPGVILRHAVAAMLRALFLRSELDESSDFDMIGGKFDPRQDAFRAFDLVIERHDLRQWVKAYDATFGAPDSSLQKRGVLALSVSAKGDPLVVTHEVSLLALLAAPVAVRREMLGNTVRSMFQTLFPRGTP